MSWARAPRQKFIPEVWSGKLVAKFYDATVFGAIANTDYEGEVSAEGDKVIIRTTPNIVIRDYVKGQTLVSETPEGDKLELLIDKAKYFQFRVDDVDEYQGDINRMEAWSADAAEQMKVNIDTGILGTIYADVAAANKGTAAGKRTASYNLGTTGAAIQLAKTTILDYIVDLGSVADEQNWPETDRWLVLPTWAAGLLKKSDLRDAHMMGDQTSVLRNGHIGRIDRWNLYTSNNVAKVADTGDKFHILAGHKSALTFASQMVKMETLKSETTFGHIVRGLNVFGYKVVKPEFMAVLYAYK